MLLLIVFQRPAGFPRSWEHVVIGWHTVRIVWLNAEWLLSNLVCGVFQPKQIKTCAIVCRPFEILFEAAENLMCARKLFLYNLLCITHHIIFVNSVWENYKSGVDFALGRHFGESQPKKLKSLFSRNKQRSKKNLNTLQLHLKSNPIRNTHRSINHRKWLLSMHVTNLLHDL